jgi:hypothetical protein
VWGVWFLASPILGALLGSIVYLAFVAGFIAATKQTLTEPSLPMLLAGMAGFSWEWAVGVIKKVTEALGGAPAQ